MRKVLAFAALISMLAVVAYAGSRFRSGDLYAIKNYIVKNTDIKVEESKKSGSMQDATEYRFIKPAGYDKVLIAVLGHEIPKKPDTVWRERYHMIINCKTFRNINKGCLSQSDFYGQTIASAMVGGILGNDNDASKVYKEIIKHGSIEGRDKVIKAKGYEIVINSSYEPKTKSIQYITVSFY